MKLGILGGTFNPIHKGHMAMAEAARSAHGLDSVLFLPAGKPPHKRDDLAPGEDRLEMVRRAVAGRQGFEASDLELRRPGITYTVDTLEELHKSYPGAEIFFIVGEDSIPELPGWKNPRRVLELARIVAVNRPGQHRVFDPKLFPWLGPDALANLERDRVSMKPSPLESNKLRESLRRGDDVDSYLPEGVGAYIRSRKLYLSKSGG